MDYSNIQTVKDYLNALLFLHQEPRGEDFHENLRELSRLASRAIFRASKGQITSAGHKEYRINFEELRIQIESRRQDNYLPAILPEPRGYDPPNIHIPIKGHLDDALVA